jgi:hypothetical protein
MMAPSEEFISRGRSYLNELSLDSITAFITEMRADYAAALELDPETNLARFGDRWYQPGWPIGEYATALNTALGGDHLIRIVSGTTSTSKTQVVEEVRIDLRDLILAKEGKFVSNARASNYLGLAEQYAGVWSAVDNADWKALNVEFDTPRNKKRYPYMARTSQLVAWNTRADTFTVPMAEYKKGTRKKLPYVTAKTIQ